MRSAYGGKWVEERDLAILLDAALERRGISIPKLMEKLKPDMFPSTRKVPSQATVYRHLGGDNLFPRDEDLVLAVWEVVTQDQEDVIHWVNEGARVKALMQTLREHRGTPLPPPTPETEARRIASLRKDLNQAQRELAEADEKRVQARQEQTEADEKVTMITHVLDQEKQRRTAAEQTAAELLPRDPMEQAVEMAARLAEARNSGGDREASRLLSNFADNDVPAAVQDALLSRLKEQSPADEQALATKIGHRKYYTLLPEVVLLLGKWTSPTAWHAVLTAAGQKYYGDQRDWLVNHLKQPEHSAAVYVFFEGAAQVENIGHWGSSLAAIDYHRLDPTGFFEVTAEHGSEFFLVQIFRYLYDRTPGWNEISGDTLDLVRAIAKIRSPVDIGDLLIALRGAESERTRDAAIILYDIKNHCSLERRSEVARSFRRWSDPSGTLMTDADDLLKNEASKPKGWQKFFKSRHSL